MEELNMKANELFKMWGVVELSSVLKSILELQEHAKRQDENVKWYFSKVVKYGMKLVNSRYKNEVQGNF